MSISLVKPPKHTTIIIDKKWYEYFEDSKGTDILVYLRDMSTGEFKFLRRVYVPKKTTPKG